MDNLDIGPLVAALQNTDSPASQLRHYPDFGLPHYWYEAVGRHDPPYSDEEESAVIEAKKNDPPAADEVFENIFLGNKGAAENTDFLVKKGITHVLNLASDTTLKFFVVPEREKLKKIGIELKEMKLRDRPGESICQKFRESGMWMRSCLLSGGKVMVNCWQGASRSATIVLAFLLQHHKMPLIDSIKMVKSKRDIRPNNGFLKQLLLLEIQLIQGTKGELVDLKSAKGQILIEKSKEEGFSKFDEIGKYFNSGVTATGYRTDQTSFQEFKDQVEHVMATKNKQMIINYHMETLGQLVGLRGHISPLAAYCRTDNMALVMDVWPETRESWVPLERIWGALDTFDGATEPPIKRGFIIVTKN